MTVVQRIELGTQLPGLGNGHIGGLQESEAGGSALRVGIRQPAIDCLPDHGCHRDATLPCHCRDTSMTLVIEQDLKAVLQ